MFSIFKIFNTKSLNEPTKCEYGNLYKLKNESLPFRYIYRKGDSEKKIHRFKHHNLKEYIYYDLDEVERKANTNEIKIYNLIKNHINDLSEKLRK